MPIQMHQYDILVSCPTDVQNEYLIISDVIDAYNRNNGEKYGVRLQTRHWYTDSYPLVGPQAQNNITKLLIDKCDFAVAIFWTKVGTRTNSEYESGTVEEIERLINAGKDVFLYFSDCPARPSECVPEQLIGVRKIKKKYRNNALYFEYSDLEQFRSKFSHNIAKRMEAVFPNTNTTISADNLFMPRTGFPEKVRSAKESLFINGVSLMSIISSSDVEEQLAKGVRVRLLVTKNCPELNAQQDKLSNKGYSSMQRHKDEVMLYIFNTFRGHPNRRLFELREIDAVMTSVFVGVDLESPNGVIHVHHYLYKTHTAQCPYYKCGASEMWFDKFKNQIELLWENGTPVDIDKIQ